MGVKSTAEIHMSKRLAHETLAQISSPAVRIAAAYGAGVATLRKLGATDGELTLLGFPTEATSDETHN